MEIIVSVSSANKKFGTGEFIGISHQFIQMGQFEFNIEQNMNDSNK